MMDTSPSGAEQERGCPAAGGTAARLGDQFAIVDAHHHLWDLQKHYYPWLASDPLPRTFLGDHRPLCRTYGIEDYLRDASSVGTAKSVHIQGGFDPADPVAETRWLQALADHHGFPHGIVAAANLSQRNVGSILEAHAGFPNTRGIRQNLNFDPDDPTLCFIDRDYMSDRQWRAGFSLLEGLGLSFDLQILPRQLTDAVELARAFPGTRIILCHMGLPFKQDQAGLEVWRSGLRLLAAESNTSVKLSGFGMINHHWRTDTIRPLVLEAIEIFGPSRCMFASNFPVEGLYGSYEAVFAALGEITAGFSASERAGMFGENAVRMYRLSQTRPRIGTERRHSEVSGVSTATEEGPKRLGACTTSGCGRGRRGLQEIP